MFHLEIWEVVEERVADLEGNSVVGFPAGRKPIGTCDDVSEEGVLLQTRHAHPIGSI